MSEQRMIHGDCLDEMLKMQDNSIDFICCDPPYGLNFMGKKWDDCVPNIEIWSEALRICKPGSMLSAFGGSRTHHHLMIALEQGGWEIRDVIFWLHGQGFPKSHNKFGLEGYGTALKPAYEPIIIAMKPIEGTFAQNAEKWGVAGINIDDSRIPTDDNLIIPTGNQNKSIYKSGLSNYLPKDQPAGRWPANIILDEESAEQLDQMTGVSKSSNRIRHNNGQNTGRYGKINPIDSNGFNDSGGPSRFFYCAKASSKERNAGLEGMPLKENMRVNAPRENEEQKNSNKMHNFHPTVKPIALMKYIIKLLAPPDNPICLDPFAGSGSTLLAAKELGINCIGIEREQEYYDIAKARLA